MTETRLKRSKDRKTAYAITASNSVSIANTFGLPPHLSCPGATATCLDVCYVFKIKQIYSGVEKVLMHNWSLLKNADFNTMVSLLDEMIVEFEAECDKRNAPKYFRFHWSGDIFSLTYARAIAKVVKMHPNTKFWIYTRSFDFVGPLRNIDNLALYLSVDKDNESRAKRFKNINLAVLADNFVEGKAMVPAPRCPENNRAIALVGACQACGLCSNGRGDVLFSISKKRG